MKKINSVILNFSSVKKNITVDKSLIFKILLQKNIIPIPNSENKLIGVINYRNNVIPVFSIYEIFFKKRDILSKNEFNEYKIMILNSNNQLIGFLIENIEMKQDKNQNNDFILNNSKLKKIFEQNETEIY